MINKKYLKWSLIAGLILFTFFWMMSSCQKSEVSISNLTHENDSSKERLEPRPDVIEWINKHFGDDSNKRTAMLRLAEAHQFLLAHPDETEKANELSSLAIACHSEAFGDSDEEIDGEVSYEALASRIFNTWSRARKRAAFYGKLSGRVLSLTDIKSWEEQCEKPLPR